MKESPESAILLTRRQLESLTGSRQPARMVAWLHRHGWIYEAPDRRGDVPKVSISYFEARMSGQATSSRRARPRLDFLTQK